MLQIVSHTPTWVFALFAGLLVFGLLQARSRSVKKMWAPLSVIMAIFFTKYLFAVMQGLGAAAASSPTTAVILSWAYGCFSGYFCARAVSLVAAERRPNNSSTPKPLCGSA